MSDQPFVVNLADLPAMAHPHRATLIDPEPEGVEWAETGVNVQVLAPGQPNCKYHREPIQEDFLVLSGECTAIIQGEERTLRQWDLFHCPPETEHVFVGAGEGPCVMLMIGSRQRPGVHYPVNEVAAKYGASVDVATDDAAEAYAEWRKEPRYPVPSPFPL